MPRFFFDIFDGIVTTDEEGHELPDIDAVRTEVRRTLPAMLQDAVTGRDKAHFRTDVHDEQGRRVLTATIVMVIDCLEEAIVGTRTIGAQAIGSEGVTEGV